MRGRLVTSSRCSMVRMINFVCGLFSTFFFFLFEKRDCNCNGREVPTTTSTLGAEVHFWPLLRRFSPGIFTFSTRRVCWFGCLLKLLPTFGHLSRFWRAYNFKSCQLAVAVAVAAAVGCCIFCRCCCCCFSCSADLCARFTCVCRRFSCNLAGNPSGQSVRTLHTQSCTERKNNWALNNTKI